MPGPVSDTATSTTSPIGATSTTIAPPGGVNLIAFVNRFVITRRKRGASDLDWHRVRCESQGELEPVLGRGRLVDLDRGADDLDEIVRREHGSGSATGDRGELLEVCEEQLHLCGRVLDAGAEVDNLLPRLAPAGGEHDGRGAERDRAEHRAQVVDDRVDRLATDQHLLVRSRSRGRVLLVEPEILEDACPGEQGGAAAAHHFAAARDLQYRTCALARLAHRFVRVFGGGERADRELVVGAAAFVLQSLVGVVVFRPRVVGRLHTSQV